MDRFVHEIRQRRVLPAVGVYAAGCWVLIEILDRLVERYLLSPYLTDIVFWGLYSLIPAVVLVSWTHGRPGKDRATRAEKVGVPINIIASLGLVVTIAGGKDLGAAATAVTLSNELGEAETHYIASEAYRRRLAVFFFARAGGAAEIGWQRYAVTELLTQDLQQSPFILATSPWVNFRDGFYVRMQQAGYDDGLDLPRSLMREIADDANRQFFIEGDVGRDDGEYVIEARIWDTATLDRTAQIIERGWDLYAVVDRLSQGVREALDIPEGSGRILSDLPLGETYGESEVALRQFIDAKNARLLDNDLAESNVHLDRALAADPDFVLAWLFKSVNQLDAGNLPAARESIEAASTLDYRLPPSDRARLTEISYRLAGENDKLLEFLRLQVRLRDDAGVRVRLANYLMSFGQLEEAKREFLATLERDPLNLGIYLELAGLERAIGDLEAAIGWAKRYREEKPGNLGAELALGDLLRDSGDLQAAEDHYRQASILEGGEVAPVLQLANVAARRGDFNRARSLLAEAETQATTPQASSLVRGAAAEFEMRMGRLHAAIEQLQRQREALIQFQRPIEMAIAAYVPMIELYLALGDTEQATRELARARQSLAPPMDQFLAFSEAGILLTQGDVAAAEAAIGRGAEIIETFKLQDLLYLSDMLTGFARRARGDDPGAARHLAAAIERLNRSSQSVVNARSALPRLYAELAFSLVAGGDLERAEDVLDQGFRLDPSEPTLWVSKARFQAASGLPRLALASVNYALAIWREADAQYTEFARARALADELQAGS